MIMQILLNCIDEKRVQILLSSGIVNTPHSICPRNQEFSKESRCVAESLEQCPVPDGFVEARTRLSFSFPWKTYVTLDIAPRSKLVNVLLCWVVIVIIMSLKLSGFCLISRSQREKRGQDNSACQHKPLQHLMHGHTKASGRWRKKLLVIFVLLGIVGSVWLFWYLNSDIVQRREEMLATMCDERAGMLQDQFNVSLNHVHALAILVSTFHHGKHPSAVDQVAYTYA